MALFNKNVDSKQLQSISSKIYRQKMNDEASNFKITTQPTGWQTSM
jgi:hypothetical protein